MFVNIAGAYPSGASYNYLGPALTKTIRLGGIFLKEQTL